MTQTLCFKTELGWVRIEGTAEGINGIVLVARSRREAEGGSTWRKDSEHEIPTATDPARRSPLLREAQMQVVEYLRGRRRQFSVPVDLSTGTPFQRRVWRAIRRIPYGRVRSYQWVAARVGGKQYARAVGMALGANPVPLVVPCHRIVAQDGSLGGFSCGLPIKRRLLALEGTLPLLRRG